MHSDTKEEALLEGTTQLLVLKFPHYLHYIQFISKLSVAATSQEKGMARRREWPGEGNGQEKGMARRRDPCRDALEYTVEP